MAENAFLWDITAANNDDADPAVPWPEGMLPGAVNNASRALMSGVARLIKDINGTLATTGSANVYAVTSSSGHSTYTNGILIAAKASFSNTAAATLNLNTYGAKNIRVFADGTESAVAAGQIISGGVYQFKYDSAADSAAGAFILLNPSPNPASGNSIGTIKIWPSDTLETGWLWANGEAASRTTYATLFALIGTTYGVGNGTTTFNVPDLCGRVPVGTDDMGAITLKSRVTNAGSGIVGTTLGASGGAQSVVLDTTQIPSHTHTGTTATEGAHTHAGTTAAGGVHGHIGTTQPGGLHSHTVSSVSGSTSNIQVQVVGGTTVGAGPSAFSTDAAAAHQHTFTTEDSVSHTHTFSTGAGTAHSHTFTSAATGGGLLHNNMPPALMINYAIRAG